MNLQFLNNSLEGNREKLGDKNLLREKPNFSHKKEGGYKDEMVVS